MNFSTRIDLITEIVERQIEEVYKEAIVDMINPIDMNTFKASTLMEISRRLQEKSLKLKYEKLHSTDVQ